MNLMLIVSHPLNSQDRELCLCDFVNQNTQQQQNQKTKQTKFNVGLYLDIYEAISFELGLVIGPTKLYNMLSVWMILTSFKVTCMINQNLWCPSLWNFAIDLDEI